MKKVMKYIIKYQIETILENLIGIKYKQERMKFTNTRKQTHCFENGILNWNITKTNEFLFGIKSHNNHVPLKKTIEYRTENLAN